MEEIHESLRETNKHNATMTSCLANLTNFLINKDKDDKKSDK